MAPRTGDQTQTAAELHREWDTDPRWAGISRDYTAEDLIDIQSIGGDVTDAGVRSNVSRHSLYRVLTREGSTITHALVEGLIREMLDGLERHPADRFDDAITVFRQVALDEENFPTFLTVGAYAQLLIDEPIEVLKPLSVGA